MTPEQPYVGIAPIPAADFPFELNDSMLPLKMLIRRLAHELNSATRAHPAFRHQGINRQMNEPRPGDLVIEQSTAYHETFDCTACGFGVLLAKRLEWETTDEAYAIRCTLQDLQDMQAGYTELTPEEHARNRTTDTAWYVQYGPDSKNVYRWVNAECIALPVTVADLLKAGKQWP